jgi:hypothetical protein
LASLNHLTVPCSIDIPDFHFRFAEEESLRVRRVTLVGESDFQLRVNQS